MQRVCCVRGRGGLALRKRERGQDVVAPATLPGRQPDCDSVLPVVPRGAARRRRHAGPAPASRGQVVQGLHRFMHAGAFFFRTAWPGRRPCRATHNAPGSRRQARKAHNKRCFWPLRTRCLRLESAIHRRVPSVAMRRLAGNPAAGPGSSCVRVRDGTLSRRWSCGGTTRGARPSSLPFRLRRPCRARCSGERQRRRSRNQGGTAAGSEFR